MHNDRQRLMARRHHNAGVAGLELLAGLGAAVACGVLWAVVAYYLEREFVYAALGVGAAVGFAVAATVKEPNAGHGISAAGLSAIGLLLGKFLIIQWSITGAVLINEVVNDPEMMTEAVFYKVATGDEADPDVKAWYLDKDATPEDAGPMLSLKLGAGFAAAEQLVGEMTTDQKLVVAEAYTDYISGSLTVTDKIKAGLSGWDFLFFGLAMFVAFQLGRGGTEGGGSNEQVTELGTEEIGSADSTPDGIEKHEPPRSDPE